MVRDRSKPYALGLLWMMGMLVLAGCTPFLALTPTPVLEPTPEPVDGVEQPYAVSVTEDLVYTIPQFGAVLEQSLDVHVPDVDFEDENGRPVFIVAHGLMQGKRDFSDLSKAIAAQGSVVFNVNWPVYSGESMLRKNGARLREMSETLACAVRFAHANADDYGGNPQQIVLVGFSAGAGMGSLVALAGESLDQQWDALALESGEPARQVDCVALEGSAHVDGFVGIGGSYGRFDPLRYEMPDLWSVVSQSAHVGENPELRVRLLHGKTDSMVPIEASEDFSNLLASAGYDVGLFRFDSGHKVPRELTLAVLDELAGQLGGRNMP
jgi:predicted esterase